MERDRILLWEACRNVRDLGGYRTPAGRTRWGALVRADSLGQLTPAGQSSLIAYGIRTVIDIRFPEEAPRDPDPFADQSGGADAPAYLNIPVSSGRDPAMDAALMAAHGSAVSVSREEANRFELDVNPVGYARIVAAVAVTEPGGVVVHCHAGHGRTGIAIALMLALVGVAYDDIAGDYGLSAPSADEAYARWLATQAHVNALEAEMLRRQSIASPQVMLRTLEHLENRYGGAEAYLWGAGLTREAIETLQTRLVEIR